jgi:hypothetical protein
MNEPTIICPTCETEFPLTETLARPYIDAERGRLAEEARERIAAIEKRDNELSQKSDRLTNLERSLNARSNDIEIVIENRLEKERSTIAAAEAKKAETRYQTQLVEARRNLEEQASRIVELQGAELEYRAKSAALDEEKRSLELNLARRLAESTNQIREEGAKEERERAQHEIQANEAALAKARADLAEAREAELELRLQREALENEKRAFELQIARKLDEERLKIREATQKEDDEQHRLKIAEKDNLIAQMAKQVDELRRKVDQGSQQLQGEVLEQDIQKILEEEFRGDEFDSVPNGQPGSDVIQRVKLANGSNCGSIVWETKNTKNWSDSWPVKIRKDQRDNNADLAVIVSTALPKSIDGFNRIEGVWITARRHAVALAKALRQALIENHQVRLANQDRDTKADSVYRYVISKDFHQRVTAMVEAYMSMRDDLDAEKRSAQRQWAKREKELDNLLVGAARLYGDFQGIVGKSMPDVEVLKLSAPAADGALNHP